MGKDMFKLGLNLLIISAVAALLLALTNSNSKYYSSKKWTSKCRS